jgi:hypothetical protein
MDWKRYRDEGREEVLAERLAGWQEKLPRPAGRRRLVRAVPARSLVGTRRIQLVVVRGHGGGMRLGSVSSAVAQSAHAPVIAVRNSE